MSFCGKTTIPVDGMETFPFSDISFTSLLDLVCGKTTIPVDGMETVLDACYWLLLLVLRGKTTIPVDGMETVE